MRQWPLFFLLLVSVFPATSAPATKAEVARYAQAQLEKHYPDNARPGAVALIARGDEVLYRGSRGAASIELGVPLSPDQMFRIGSITKQFTAVAILKLAEEGRLSLDDPLSKFVGSYPNGKAITIRQLLGHTSGVKNYFEISDVVSNRIQHDATTTEIIDTFRNEPSKFPPGEGFAYSNSGYVLLGSVIESVTGMPWHQYLQEALFLPLGMRHTGHEVGSKELISVKGYSTENGNIVPATSMSLSWAHAAGGAFSTADDLLTWNLALHEGRTLGKKYYREMITPGDGKGGQYGLGVSIEAMQGHVIYGHSGVINGFSSCSLYSPESRMTVVVLENSDGGGEGEGPCPFAHQLAGTMAGISEPSGKSASR